MIVLAHMLLPASLTAPLRRAGLAAGTVVGNVAHRWRHRQEIRQLAEFDDRMLSDIGLTRSEVMGALAEPFLRHRAVHLLRWNEQPLRSENLRASRRIRPAVSFLPQTRSRA
jgi:uncharacterized protein YjiS (DUF1127 family)